MSQLDGFEFDPYEYADQLGYTDELTRGDFSDPAADRAVSPEERRRLSRRDLLVKGGVGAAALTGLGAMAGRASAAGQAAGGQAQGPGSRDVRRVESEHVRYRQQADYRPKPA